MERSILQLVHHSATDPHVLDGQALELDFSENRFSGAFVRQVIELLKISGREVTFRMRTQDELMLDESDYTVDVDGYTTRYASEKSGILIEVKGPFMAVRSTAEGPPKKQRRRTNEQV